MAQKYYSKTTNGFYSSDIHGTNMPSDAVGVSDANYTALMSAVSSGQTIQADSNGNPEAVTFVPTTAQIHAALVTSAQAALQKSDVWVVRILSAGVAVPSDIMTYRSALRAIVNGTDVISTTLPTTPTDFPSGT